MFLEQTFYVTFSFEIRLVRRMLYSFNFQPSDNLDPFEKEILNAIHRIIANQKDHERLQKYLRTQFEPHSELFEDLEKDSDFLKVYTDKKKKLSVVPCM